jgi:hypothetical protein
MLAVSIRSARRFTWISCPAAVAMIALSLSAPASADSFLGTINVPLDGSKVYSAPLVAGGVYRIVASGTYTQTGGGGTVVRDAVYCFDFYAPPVGCSPPDAPRRSYLVIVRYEGDTSLVADLDALDPATTLAYNPSHTYQETFTAPSSSRLEVFFKGSQTYSYSGGIRLDLYLVSLPPAPGPGGGGSGSPGGAASPLLLPAAKTWGQAGPATALAPGGEAIATSPPIAASQRGASVTLSGDNSGETAVVIGTPTSTRHGFKTGRPTGGDCVRAAVGFYKSLIQPADGDFTYDGDDIITGDRSQALLFTTLFLMNCLDLVKTLDQRANQASLAPAAGAARVACKLRATPVSVKVNRAAGTASWKTRRASRHEPVRRLRGYCRQASNGTVKLHIRTASRRIKLRKVVGPRLVVGVYRSTAASGTANVRATFKRR